METIFLIAEGLFYCLIFVICVISCMIGGAAAGTAIGIQRAIQAVPAAFSNHFHFHNWGNGSADKAEPAVTRYLFGPGFRQLSSFYSDSARIVEEETERYRSARFLYVIKSHAPGITFAYARYYASVLNLNIWIYSIFTLIWASLGFLLCIGAAVMFLLHLAVRGTDLAFLHARRIRADCPVHKGSFRIPAFRCSNPSCGRLHRELFPNKYGILYHRCVCGARLPSVVLSGRDRLEACCPVPGCGGKMIASNARPLAFQLVGGSSAGKTSFLASMVHLLRQRAADAENIDFKIPEDYTGAFSRLERIYNGEEPCRETEQRNAEVFPMLLRGHQKTNRILSFYDISGKRFTEDARTKDQQQMQFGYCDAFLLLLDPFSSGTLRSRKEQNGELPEGFSGDRAEDVVVSFVNYLLYLGVMKVDQRCPTPLYVLIAKADEPELCEALPPELIQMCEAEEDGDSVCPAAGQSRDGICRDFLQQYGLEPVLSALKSFKTVYFYPVSAIGRRVGPNMAFAPWGLEPLLDNLLAQTDPYLSENLRSTNRI